MGRLMYDELERMWKETVVSHVLSRHLPEGTEQTHEILPSGKYVY
jgi:hypothetical protein